MTKQLMTGTVLLGLVATFPGLAEEKPLSKTAGQFDVRSVRNIPYYEGKDVDPVKHKLDLYLPKEAKDFPVLFFVHGGAWKSGNKELYSKLGQMFARNGIGAVVINYRLSPKVQHPAHIQDVARAFAWTHAHIAEFGGRRDQIFISGHSAGGHLVALLGTDESYLKAEKLGLKDIKGVVALSGVYLIKPGRLDQIFGKDEAGCSNASPLTHVSKNHPPFLIVYADKDFPLCDKMSEMLHEALRKNQCESGIQEIKNRSHISIIVWMSRDDDPTTQAVLSFISKHSNLKTTAGVAGR